MKRLNQGTGYGSRLLSLLVAVVIAYTQLFSTVALAQIEDNEDPVIIHRQADSPGVAGELQTFLARVYDDVEVVGVTLYYRQSAVAAFKGIPMRPLLDSLGEYMIAIETEISEYPGLQYYIEAVDASGNVTSRGFPYAPIVMPLKAPDPNAAPPPEPAPIIAQSPDTTPASGGSSSSILLGLGALLILGAIAGGASGGDEPVDPPTPGITLTIISDGPGGN